MQGTLYYLRREESYFPSFIEINFYLLRIKISWTQAYDDNDSAEFYSNEDKNLC